MSDLCVIRPSSRTRYLDTMSTVAILNRDDNIHQHSTQYTCTYSVMQIFSIVTVSPCVLVICHLSVSHLDLTSWCNDLLDITQTNKHQPADNWQSLNTLGHAYVHRKIHYNETEVNGVKLVLYKW